MFKHLTLIVFLVFITPQFLFSQEGKYALYNHVIYKSEDMKLTNMVVIDVQPRGDIFQVTGTYYEYRGNGWNSIGSLGGTLKDGIFKGTGKIYSEEFNVNGGINNTNARISREEENSTQYSGEQIPNISGIYYKDGNENDVCRVAQDGPFIELIDENNNTSKGVILNKSYIFAIDWNMQGGIMDKDQINIKNAKWTKNSIEAKDFTGDWSTQWGTMTLSQSGGKVTGSYSHEEGKIDGTVSHSGDTLVCKGKWTQPASKGEFVFKLIGDHFDGGYNYSTSPEYWHEDWDGNRMAGK